MNLLFSYALCFFIAFRLSILLVVTLVPILTHKAIPRHIFFVIVSRPSVFLRIPPAIGISSFALVRVLSMPTFVFVRLGSKFILGLFRIGARSGSLLFMPFLVMVAFMVFVFAAVGRRAAATIVLFGLVFVVLMLSGHTNELYYKILFNNGL